MEQAEAIKVLQSGGVGVLPTDTLYGLVGSALAPETVARIYKLRERSEHKAPIILIGKLTDLITFGITITQWQEKVLPKVWPGQVSVILPLPTKNTLVYLHRGNNTLAFRLPNDKNLVEILKQTGPLIAPSTNPEGASPAETISEAKNYFGDQVDFYLDAGPLVGAPSTLISLVNNKVEILRQGAVQIPSDLLH